MGGGVLLLFGKSGVPNEVSGALEVLSEEEVSRTHCGIWGMGVILVFGGRSSGGSPPTRQLLAYCFLDLQTRTALSQIMILNQCSIFFFSSNALQLFYVFRSHLLY